MRPRQPALPPVRLAWRVLGRRDELAYWRSRPDLIGDGALGWAYTELFGLEPSWYDGKRLLDVGCGPRGSLDWATGAAARVGLDPLADRYVAELGVDARAMDYVNGTAEAMPFPDASFDVVGSFNSLDHVEDVERAAAEIKRVLRPGGTLLLVTDVNHPPRLTEPQTFGWEVTELFAPELELVEERRYEPHPDGTDAALRAGVAYADPGGRAPGLLVARMRRVT
jgi:SAM-dependent methyltransferase